MNFSEIYMPEEAWMSPQKHLTSADLKNIYAEIKLTEPKKASNKWDFLKYIRRKQADGA